MITHDCGCVNEVHEPSGILHSVSKCAFHLGYARDPATLDEAYYTELAQLDGSGEFLNSAHLAELLEALGPLPVPNGSDAALEIGCGVSPYVAAIEEAGWFYWGIDSSPWAAGWTGDHWNVLTRAWSFEQLPRDYRFGLVLCCHALEHMIDAPAALEKMAEVLVPGGHLWLLVPDDSDPVNPDHWWHFTEATLRAGVEKTGLTVDRLVSRSIVPRENFLYMRARKA